VAYGLNTSDVWYRRITAGIANGWYRIIDSLNIGSQSVAYASEAGNAYNADNANYWSGLDGYELSYGTIQTSSINSLYGYNDDLGVPTKFDSGSVKSWLGLNSAVTSMGMSGYIPKFNSFNSLVNSPIYVDFNNVSIGGTYAFYPMHILTESGNVSLYASYDIVAFSDISVKENLRPIENVLSRICKSRGVLYDRIDSGAKDNIGFIAQELEVQFPELVIENEDGTKAVKYQNAVAVLFEAVKEQQKQIDDLKELVNKLIRK
jgi:hypothetical protein